ncbi:MAG: DUF4145 domain-containing protein [Leptospirillum sp.]|jgi:hypothetical protein
MAKSRGIHKVSREVPEGKDIDKAWEEINKGNDRSAAIIGAAFVEDSLQCALESRMIGLNSQVFNEIFNNVNGPLCSFSSKILLGFALGLYREVLKKDLNVIRNIRNAFAHSMKPITFDIPEVENELKNLRFLEWDHKNPPIPSHPHPKEFSFPDSNRKIYINTVKLLVHRLFFFGLITNRKSPDQPKLP